MLKTLLKVLLVEDDPDYAEFVKLSLADADLTSFDLERVDCLAAARGRLESNDYDVILLDLGLPDACGFEALSQVRDQRSEVPVVVLTGNCDPCVGVEAASIGAHDYLYKGDLNARTLERVLRYTVHRQQLFCQLCTANESLDHKNDQLEKVNALLDQKNARLAQLYETAHQFVDNVSHDFRTPLTVIKEYVSIIRDGLAGQVTEQQRQYLAIVNDRADDLAIMVDDMLDVSKFEAGLLRVWRQETSVSDILGHVRPVLERKAAVKEVTLEISLDEDLPVVYCDPEKVGRVIINLAANAIKFCKKGGSVRVWARRGTNQPEITIGITDDGPGISPENLKRIFKRFHQAEGATPSSAKGFGLGLSIAKDLVALNLGKIDVESEPGKGSTFSFSVPVSNPQELAARYLERMVWSDDRPGNVALVLAAVDAPIEQAVSNVADEFLQHTFRGSDLIVRILPHKWLVLAQCPQGEVGKMLDRVHAAWAENNRNMPGEKLPKITLRTKGSWSEKTRAEEVIRQFQSELVLAAEEPKGSRILLVDDDHELVCGLGIRLRAAGYEVLTAFDGQSAVDSAIEHRPEAILMDNYMSGMDGLGAMEELRRHPETMDVPVIMFSASTRDRQKALEQGACYFLQKPCDVSTITAGLREVIAEPSRAGFD